MDLNEYCDSDFLRLLHNIRKFINLIKIIETKYSIKIIVWVQHEYKTIITQTILYNNNLCNK